MALLEPPKTTAPPASTPAPEPADDMPWLKKDAPTPQQQEEELPWLKPKGDAGSVEVPPPPPASN